MKKTGTVRKASSRILNSHYNSIYAILLPDLW